MESKAIKFIPNSSSIYNFQKCTLGLELVKEIEEKFGKFFETFISISCRSSSRILLRCCKSNIGDVASVIQGDLRVTELIFDEKSESGDDVGSSLKEKDDGKCGFHGKEMDLCRHLLAKMNVKELKSGFDVDEDGELSSMRFNDALWCTSKDIQMLKSSTIKKMRLTVISDSPLSDFPDMGNQQRVTGVADAAAPSFLSKNLSEDETTTNSRISSNWKLLREKIRQTFQSYDIHVKSNTLVDLRDCPLSSCRKPACPSVSFIFVEECSLRNSDCDIGKVASKTEILISHVHHISHYKRQLSAFKSISTYSSSKQKQHETDDDDDEKLHGLENATKVLTSLIDMQTRVCRDPKLEKYFGLVDNFYSHGLLIAGPSGCGKSLAVRKVVKKLRANLLVFKLNVSSSGAKSVQDFTSLAESWTENFISSIASANLYPTVLLIPKIDESLLIKQNKSKSFVDKLLNHVCNLLDSIPTNSMLTVVATTNKPYLIPAKLRRAGRLEREVYIGSPTEEERVNILQSLCKKVPSLRKLNLDSVARRTPGYVGQDLIRVAHLAILKSYEENCTQVTEVHIKYALSKIQPSILQGSLGVVGIQRATSLDHIAGLHSVKLDLIKAIVWPLRHPHAFRIMGITPPKGILLHSPPGCAKTTLVRAVAASHQTNFLSVSAAELFSSGVGDSEKIVADLFHRARMASPCILFIDELEAIVGSRVMSQKREKTTNESILSMLLTEMDGVGTQSPCTTDRVLESNANAFGPSVLVVAATNRIDMIDSALIRPGRFDKLIYVPPLDLDGRTELLSICSNSIPFSEDIVLEEIAANTENYTGADLVNLCREAALLALTDNMEAKYVSLDNFIKAKSIVSPSLSDI